MINKKEHKEVSLKGTFVFLICSSLSLVALTVYAIYCNLPFHSALCGFAAGCHFSKLIETYRDMKKTEI